jgi:predicted NBD/HSP70 family sugar kinase
MNHRLSQDLDHSPGSVGDVLRRIRTSDAMSRSTLARTTGLAPSTVSLRVDVLIGMGLVHEVGNEDSRGGRRARRLRLDGSAGFVAAVDLGANHVRIVLSDLAGGVLVDTDMITDGDASATERHRLPMSDGPAVAVTALWNRLVQLADDHHLAMGSFRGVAIGVPAPIAHPSGRIVTPSFQPTWHDADLPGLFAAHTDAPVLVENDANLIAIAERPERTELDDADDDQLLAVKLGTRIGCGIIASGRLHRGVGGAAGEVSHTAVDGVAMIGCTCGVPNCLESVASGGAIAARLRQAGYTAETPADLLALGAQGDPVVVDAIRAAGAQIGQVLAGMVNFFNPREVVLAGTMSASMPLVAAIRAELYQRCLPIVADDLEVRASRNPQDAGVRGATILILDEVLAPARIDELVRDDAQRAAAVEVGVVA